MRARADDGRAHAAADGASECMRRSTDERGGRRAIACGAWRASACGLACASCSTTWVTVCTAARRGLCDRRRRRRACASCSRRRGAPFTDGEHDRRGGTTWARTAARTRKREDLPRPTRGGRQARPRRRRDLRGGAPFANGEHDRRGGETWARAAAQTSGRRARLARRRDLGTSHRGANHVETTRFLPKLKKWFHKILFSFFVN